MQRIIRLSAVSSADRNTLISGVSDTVSLAGGWIEDVHFFSNISIALHFVIPAGARSMFVKLLGSQSMALDSDDIDKFTELLPGGENEEVSCTLQITFNHNDPDLRRHIPSVPG